MNKRKTTLKAVVLSFLLMTMSFFTYAQSGNVTGKVTDNMDMPIPGATIMIKGTTTGTISDVNGDYSLKVNSTDMTIVFSFIGMDTQEIPLANQTVINVKLQSSAFDVDEVIVVGYGSQKRSDVIGSVASVGKERLENIASSNVLESVQGSTPGVYIRRGDDGGQPGEQANIRIRGINTMGSGGASSDPLIVVDGIPFASGNLSDIAPSDIESMEILKDASSAAIYGSRSANGVILITTKRGQNGSMKVDLNASVTLEQIANKPNLMTGDEFLEFRREAYDAAGLPSDNESLLSGNELDSYNAGIETDWMDELTRTAVTQNYQVSLSGGNEKSKYYMSGSYINQEGIVINSGYERMSLKLNVDHKLNDWLSIGNSLLFTNSDYNPADFGKNDQAAYDLTPWGKLKEDDGSYTMYPMYSDDYYTNIVNDNLLYEIEDKRTRFFNNAFLLIDFPFVKGLSYRLNYGLDMKFRNKGDYWPEGTGDGIVVLDDPTAAAVYGKASSLNYRKNSWTLENILNYKKKINPNNKIDITAMVSRQDYNFEQLEASAQGFISGDYLWNQLAAGAIQDLPVNKQEEWSLLSAMGRLNYSLMDKYLLTMTIRSDGYSAFAENYKWSSFPSVGLAWKISNEPFLRGVGAIESLKLRASYGHSGNQGIDPYESLAQLETADHVFGQTSANGVAPGTLANPNLTWETTKAANIAIDYSLFAGRISGTIEYYNTNTIDLLWKTEIPAMSGFSDIIDNVGSVNNQGIDFEIRSVNVHGNSFKWQTFFNLSKFNDKITDIHGDKTDDVGNELFIGERSNVYYEYEADGVWQSDDDIAAYYFNTAASQLPSPGDARLVDQEIDGERDGVINADDNVIIGSPNPTMLLGMTNVFTYKNLTLSIFVHSVHGNIRKVNIDGVGRFNTYEHDYWTETNPSNEYQRPNNSGTAQSGSLYYHDANFLRLKDISLSYNFPKRILEKVKVNGLALTFNARDLYTLTSFPGDDPEVGSSYKYPVPMSFLFGIKLTL